MYFEVKVQIEVDTDNGKPKKKTESYLVDAMTVTEAEARVHTYFKGSVVPFEVKSAKVSPIVDIIQAADETKS